MADVSILNDVIGPVMRGPSSSHTAGAYRIAKLTRDLLGGRPATLQCAFDPEGSYAPTYLPLGVDVAFAAGCLDWEMTDPRYKESLGALAEAGTALSFEVAALERSDHPNAVRIRGARASQPTREVWARSTGGGIVQIYCIDGWEVSIDGRSWTVIVRLDGTTPDRFAAAADPLLDGAMAWRSNGLDGKCLLQGDSQARIPDDVMSRLRALDGVSEVRLLRPILFTQPGEALFKSAEGMLAAARDAGLGLGDMARRYESALLARPEVALDEEMLARYRVMQQSVAEGLDDSRCELAYCRPSASSILSAADRGTLPVGGLHTRAAARAMAAMHVCNSKGVVCAAPTGGSAGVLPGVLLTLADECRVAETTVVRSLFAAGAVGLIMAERATFAAEVAGCQVEIGVAGAMGAAAVVDAMGGSAEQACHAAAISLQNTMGSVCDPVGGACELPCQTRNAVAASSAFVCADLVMGGYANPIPLDETIDASYEVGQMLPSQLRCTARGGLATTPAAQELVARHACRGGSPTDS